ncbi:MAG: ABC transporter ATP-binding protein [Candidatus Woesearchaeota archaeon]
MPSHRKQDCKRAVEPDLKKRPVTILEVVPEAQKELPEKVQELLPSKPILQPDKKMPGITFDHSALEPYPEKINFWHNMGIYFRLLKPYKLNVMKVVVVIFILQCVALAAQYLMTEMVDKGVALMGCKITLDDLVYIFIGFLVVKFFCKGYNMHLANRLDAYLVTDLKTKFYDHFMSQSYTFHRSNKSGAIISGLIRGSEAILKLTDVFVFDMLPQLFHALLVLWALFRLDLISCNIVTFVGIFFLAFSLFISYIQQKYFLRSTEAEDMEKASISDTLANIEPILFSGKVSAVKRRYEKTADGVRSALLKNWDYYRYMEMGQSFIEELGMILLIASSARGIATGTTTLGNLMFIYVTYSSLVDSMSKFATGIKTMFLAMSGFESLFHYLGTKNELVDAPNAKNFVLKEGRIELRDVGVYYGKDRKNPDVYVKSLTIPAGKTVAIVGQSGAGKSTLFRVITGMIPFSGKVLIDGQDIRKVKQDSLRKKISVVLQNCALFVGSVYENVRFFERKAKKGRILRALRLARLLDKKDDSSSNLSGGERQRVAVARALLAKNGILLLDEPTSSQDSLTEQAIQVALDTYMPNGKVTTVIIAHKLSTIQRADFIVVMDKGSVVGIGTHDELMERRKGCDMYRRLWTLQKGGYIGRKVARIKGKKKIKKNIRRKRRK